LAKAGLYAVVTFVVTAAASLVAFLVAQPFFGSRGVGLGVAELPGALLGTAGYLTAIAVLAVAPRVPAPQHRWRHRDAVRAAAGRAADRALPPRELAGPRPAVPAELRRHGGDHGERLAELLSPTGGALVLAAWALVPLAGAAVALRRRDA
jgi:hypothetical protein